MLGLRGPDPAAGIYVLGSEKRGPFPEAPGPARSQLRSCCVIGSMAVGSRRDGPRPLAPHPPRRESTASPATSHPPAECVPSSTPNPPTSVPGTAMNADPWLDSETHTPLP